MIDTNFMKIIRFGTFGEIGDPSADHLLLFKNLNQFLKWNLSDKVFQKHTKDWIRKYYKDKYEEYFYCSRPIIKGRVSLLKRYTKEIDDFFKEPTDEELRSKWEKGMAHFKEKGMYYPHKTFTKYKTYQLLGSTFDGKTFRDNDTPKGKKRRALDTLMNTEAKYFAICQSENVTK